MVILQIKITKEGRALGLALHQVNDQIVYTEFSLQSGGVANLWVPKGSLAGVHYFLSLVGVRYKTISIEV